MPNVSLSQTSLSQLRGKKAVLGLCIYLERETSAGFSMKYEVSGKNMILTDIQDFDLAETLECGQCFHFVRTDDSEKGRKGVSEYALAAFGRGLRVRQEDDTFTFFDTDEDEFVNVWVPYFDLERDYSVIKDQIAEGSPELEGIIKKNSGIRLLNQEFFETLLSFIISQNNRIPQIKKVVADISKSWGSFLFAAGDEEIYSFPDSEALAGVCEDDFREKKTGFRASYLCDGVKRFLGGELDEKALRSESLEDCEKQLCSVKGVGTKVANCIMVFSLGRREAFPIDVWMKRLLEKVYFGGKEKSKPELAAFAKEKYGEYGGYAQQYLFAYAREEL